jgi:hypothetical protein
MRFIGAPQQCGTAVGSFSNPMTVSQVQSFSLHAHVYWIFIGKSSQPQLLHIINIPPVHVTIFIY